MALDLNELRELLTALNQTDIAELTLKSEAFELTVRRNLGAPRTTAAVVSAAIAASAPETAPTSAPAPVIEPPTPFSPPPKNDRRLLEITSPMVGTFYRAPAPGESAFVEVGDRVQTGQTVCIIEAMKLMNELETEVSGEVVEILVQNGEPVEYGQPLMRVNPV